MKKILKILLLSVLSVACVMTAIACSPNEGGDDKDKGLLCKTLSGVYTIYKYVDDGRESTTLDIGAELGEEHTGVKIKANAFSGNDTIEEIIVPNSVTAIEEGAFAGMKSLKKITLPFVGASVLSDGTYGDSAGDPDKAIDLERTFGYIFGTSEYDGGSKVTITAGSSTSDRYIPTTLRTVEIVAENGYKIPMDAFNGCTILSEIKLNSGIAEIGENAFNGCKNLSSIIVPETVSVIRKGAFSNCTSLNADVLDSATALVEIGESAFAGATLESITLPANVVIGKKAFSGSTVKAVTLKGTVTIGDSAFASCVKLTTVTLDNVSNGIIRQFAFQGAVKLNQFGGTAGTIDLTKFATVENMAFADIFADSTKINVLPASETQNKLIFGWN